MSITNTTGKHVYPISTFTWLLVSADLRDAAKKAALRDLLRWMLTTGQKQCSSLGYAPLPAGMASASFRPFLLWTNASACRANLFWRL